MKSSFAQKRSQRHKFVSSHAKLQETAVRNMAQVKLHEVVIGKAIGQQLNQMRRVRDAFMRASPGCADLVTLKSFIALAEDAVHLGPAVIMSTHKTERLKLLESVCPHIEEPPEMFRINILHCRSRLLTTNEMVEEWLRLVLPFTTTAGVGRETPVVGHIGLCYRGYVCCSSEVFNKGAGGGKADYKCPCEVMAALGIGASLNLQKPTSVSPALQRSFSS